MMSFDEIDHSEIFNLPIEIKKEIIDHGAHMVWEQCILSSKLTKEKFSVVLSRTMGALELRIHELQNDEQYELCYYLNEVIWSLHRRIQDNRNDKPIF